MSKPNGITREEFNQRRREKYKEYTKKCALNYVAKGLCRACGGEKDSDKTQHCDRCERRRRSTALKRLYGITADEYEELSAKQGHVCWICKKKVTSKNGNLLVDHNHKTGKIRGLLCTKCNAGLGGFCDSVELLQRAVEYLTVFGETQDGVSS